MIVLYVFLILLGTIVYLFGMFYTLETMSDKDIKSGAIVVLFTMLPVFNIIYPFIYGNEIKEDFKKMFKK